MKSLMLLEIRILLFSLVSFGFMEGCSYESEKAKKDKINVSKVKQYHICESKNIDSIKVKLLERVLNHEKVNKEVYVSSVDKKTVYIYQGHNNFKGIDQIECFGEKVVEIKDIGSFKVKNIHPFITILNIQCFTDKIVVNLMNKSGGLYIRGVYIYNDNKWIERDVDLFYH